MEKIIKKNYTHLDLLRYLYIENKLMYEHSYNSSRGF